MALVSLILAVVAGLLGRDSAPIVLLALAVIVLAIASGALHGTSL